MSHGHDDSVTPKDVHVGEIVEETSKPYNAPLVRTLNKIINFAVRAMAVMMTVVIFFGVVDVGWTIYQRLVTEPFMILRISDFLAIFGAFMAVLIAMEIFVNITIYLREDVIHVNIVLATALMAIARKVITLDLKETTAEHMYGLAGLTLAMGIGYWLIVVRGQTTVLKAASLLKQEDE
jgi:uncharacterized membrane protein (DUF373 family)